MNKESEVPMNQEDLEKKPSGLDSFPSQETMEELDDFVARPVTAYEDCPEREECR